MIPYKDIHKDNHKNLLIFNKNIEEHLKDNQGRIYFNLNKYCIGVLESYESSIFSIYYRIEKLIIGPQVKEINPRFFRFTRLVHIDLSFATELEIIKWYSFYNNKYLKKVILGPYLKEIHDNAFSDCPLLETVEFMNDTEEEQILSIGSSCFSNCVKLKNIIINANTRINLLEGFAFIIVKV